MAFRLCEQWMSRQTKQYDHWIVVDDGDQPTQTTLGQTVIRRKRQQSEPLHTLHLNLLSALPLVKTEKLMIIEDDDYYSPLYIETMDKWLDNASIAGQGEAIYYNVKYKNYTKNRNKKHCSLCQTGLTYYNYYILKEICKKNPKFIDHELWRLAAGKRYIELTMPKLAVGIKAMPGRAGIASGHVNMPTNDASLEKFKQCLGNDAEVYINYLSMVAEDIDLPPELKRVRRDPFGNLFLLRRNDKLERLLNQHCIKIDTLTWSIKHKNIADINKYKDIYKGKDCYIVGKGPSLDKLNMFTFDNDSPIICINEAGKIVEEIIGLKNPIYCIQQDAGLKDTCKIKGTMLVSYLCQAWYDKAIAYNPAQFGYGTRHPLSIEMAISFAKLWGCKKIKFHACDALVNGNTKYAKKVGYESTKGGNPSRFITHKKYIDKSLEGIDFIYLT